MNFVSLTSVRSATIVGHRKKLSKLIAMAANPLKELEKKIDDLISLCKELNIENGALKAEIAGWQDERKDLLDKNELARSKVEAMIDRLRSME